MPKIQKRSPRGSQKCAKLAILASKLAILGTSWRQVGQLSAILAHLGAKMRPNRHPNGAPDAPQLASWAILAPRVSPKTSKVPPEPHFSTIFPPILDRIRQISVAIFLNFQPSNFAPNSIDFSSSFRELILQTNTKRKFEPQVPARWRLVARMRSG